MGRRLSFKQKLKLTSKSCYICEEDNYSLLDVHRILPGSEGGKYSKFNSICLCCKCHRKCHSGDIVIDRKYNSSKGVILHYFEDGKEFWK